jgi:predicted nucleic acid-binding protein
MKLNGALLDTSFFIRLLNDEDPLHKNAKGYYKYFLENDITLKISTISIAEYCVRGTVNDLPWLNLQVLPFNYNHAIRTGAFASAIFEQKQITGEQLHPRAIIPNDSKLFAQADLEDSIQYFITSDTRSLSVIKVLNKKIKPNFQFIDINNNHSSTFGILDFQ